ncbi:hypothetical protein CEXT_585561 [Caerostris extrusa]|uniref:Uncharacterized protein n=1 Tax=Caerostris extrusa TaxID=172846 RepID=A0AAV4Y284_CAEEX|nr:hypothetical protein CEXT_585561 [Caerostris extrusa]
MADAHESEMCSEPGDPTKNSSDFSPGGITKHNGGNINRGFNSPQVSIGHRKKHRIDRKGSWGEIELKKHLIEFPNNCNG